MYFTVKSTENGSDFKLGEFPSNEWCFNLLGRHLPVDQIRVFFGNPKSIRPKFNKSKH